MSDQNKRGTKRKALSLLDKLEIIRRVIYLLVIQTLLMLG